MRPAPDEAAIIQPRAEQNPTTGSAEHDKPPNRRRWALEMLDPAKEITEAMNLLSRHDANRTTSTRLSIRGDMK
ncbi:hypothetical protein [Bradyrhizobium oligotrophicum]|uniref:hypothetical protein n=1 Tax=Bradyrhizobium oligotrophicum TaxID=44255 RepID=UPI003EB7B129